MRSQPYSEAGELYFAKVASSEELHEVIRLIEEERAAPFPQLVLRGGDLVEIYSGETGRFLKTQVDYFAGLFDESPCAETPVGVLW